MPGENRATQTGVSSLIVTDEGSTCDDCGAAMEAWLETHTGSLLCFTCADAWEDLELEAAVQA